MSILAKRSLLVLIISSSYAAHAQQFPVVSQYVQNPVFLNPGATGADGKNRAQLLYRSQWTGYDPYSDASNTAPELQLLTVALRIKERTDSTVAPGRHGIGAVVMRDKLASLTTIDAKLSYAYHLPFTKRSTLALGVQAGMQNRSIDYNKYRVKHPDDPWLPQGGEESQWRPVLTAGLWFEHERYYLGLAINGITESPLDDLGIHSNRNYTFTAGCHIIHDPARWTLSPTIMALSNEEEYLVAGGINAAYQNVFQCGVTYRHEEAVSATLGLGLLEQKQLYISYAVDYITSNADIKANTSHEVMIGYRWE